MVQQTHGAITRVANQTTTQSLPNSLPTNSSPEPARSRKAIRAIIARCLHRCAPIYKENLIGDTVAIYADALEDLSESQINEGFNRCLRESKFWPRPSELRAFCTGIDPTSVGANNDRVMEAWIAKIVARVGMSYHEGVFSSDTQPAMAAHLTRDMDYVDEHFSIEPGRDERWAVAVASDAALAVSRRRLQAPDIDEEAQ